MSSIPCITDISIRVPARTSSPCPGVMMVSWPRPGASLWPRLGTCCCYSHFFTCWVCFSPECSHHHYQRVSAGSQSANSGPSDYQGYCRVIYVNLCQTVLVQLSTALMVLFSSLLVTAKYISSIEFARLDCWIKQTTLGFGNNPIYSGVWTISPLSQKVSRLPTSLFECNMNTI